MLTEMTPLVEVPGYEILEEIGAGGMASVYRARQPSLDRIVAIKVLPTFLSEKEGFRERFRREARAIAKLRHPNILTIHDYGESGSTAYIVSEFVDGGSLTARAGEIVPVGEVVRLLTPIAEALDHAHGEGIVHRDVKPANVLLTTAGRPILTDFGLAKILGSAALTEVGSILGTPEYMSPEQCAGDEPGPASDQYSLAIMAYQFITGRTPFTATTPIALVMKQLNEPPPSASTLIPDLDPAVDRALQRALAKKPEARFPSCLAFVEALGGGESISAVPAESKSRRRRPVIAAAGALVLAVLVGVGYALVFLKAPAPRPPAGPVLMTLAGTGHAGLAGDGGNPLKADLNSPLGVAASLSGVSIADSGNSVLRRIPANGTAILTPPLAPADERGNLVPGSISLRNPSGLATGADGSIYIADTGNNRILHLNLFSNALQVIAGTGEAGFNGDGLPGTDSQLNRPLAIVLDGLGHLFIADTGNGRLREMDLATGLLTTLAGGGEINYFQTTTNPRINPRALHFERLTALAIDSYGQVFFADAGQNAIFAISAPPIVYFGLVAGVTGKPGFAGDGGPAREAVLNGPVGLAVDSRGNLYIADGGNNRIRRVDSTQKISTLVGGPQSRLTGPVGLAVDGTGRLLIAESGANRIRSIQLTS